MAACGVELQSHREQDTDMCTEQSTPERQSLKQRRTGWGQIESGLNHTREDRTGEDRTGQDWARQDRRWDKTGWFVTGCGLGRPEQVSPGHDRSEVIRTGPCFQKCLAAIWKPSCIYMMQTPVGSTVNYELCCFARDIITKIDKNFVLMEDI